MHGRPLNRSQAPLRTARAGLAAGVAAALLLAGAGAALAGGASVRSARAADPIVGVWTNDATGGAVTVKAAGGGSFVGVVTTSWMSTDASGSLRCPHRVGQVVWRITLQQAGRYTGTNSGFLNDASTGRTCADDVAAATWSLASPTSLSVEFHSALAPGTATYTRPAPPEPGSWVTVPFSFSGTQHSATFYATITGKGVVRAARPESDGMSGDVRLVSSTITLRYAPKPDDIRGAYVIGIGIVAGAGGKLEGATYDASRKELRWITLRIASSASPDCVVGIKGWLKVLSETGRTITIAPSSWAFCGDKATYSSRGFQWYDRWATVKVG